MVHEPSHSVDIYSQCKCTAQDYFVMVGSWASLPTDYDLIVLIIAEWQALVQVLQKMFIDIDRYGCIMPSKFIELIVCLFAFKKNLEHL